MRPLNILTWNTHTGYLYCLTRAPHQFHVISKPGRPAGYAGRCGTRPWGAHVHDLPASQARRQELDCIIFQDAAQFDKDQYELLSAAQRALPRIYIEHDPPRDHVTDARHPIDNPDVLLVHVTHFNALMWDNGRTPTRVIEHGVVAPGNTYYRGDKEAGLVAVHHLARGGRRMGADLFCQARQQVKLDLVGRAADELGGLGDIAQAELPAFAARYRFLFHPVRYASMDLAVIEAMMIGMPVVALATTDMSTAIDHGSSGYVDSNLVALVGHMQELLRHPSLARQLGVNARRRARERFGIDRFCADWDAALAEVTSISPRTRRS